MYCILYYLFPVLHYNGGTDSLHLRAYGYKDWNNYHLALYRKSMPTLSYEVQVKHGGSRALPTSLQPPWLASVPFRFGSAIYGFSTKWKCEGPVQKSPQSFPLLPRLSLSVCHGICLFMCKYLYVHMPVCCVCAGQSALFCHSLSHSLETGSPTELGARKLQWFSRLFPSGLQLGM